MQRRIIFRQGEKIDLQGISNLVVYYHGKPKVAKNAPWDGGFIWTKDKTGNPWITVACQGLGPAFGIHAKITRAMNQTARPCISQRPLIS